MVWSWVVAEVSQELAEGLYEQSRAGDKAPRWFQVTMPSPLHAAVMGWDEDNPIWHLWKWMGSAEAGEGAEVMLEDFPELKQKMLERWNVEFWIPLYAAACDLSFPDYAASLKAIFPTVEAVFYTYGRSFVAPWYAKIAERPDGQEFLVLQPIAAEEYLRRRTELGCPVSGVTEPFSIYEKHGLFGAVSPIPALPVPGKAPWIWAGLGAVAVGVAVALYLRNKPKGRRRTKK